MNKEPIEDNEMPAEIDFSKGVHGIHHIPWRTARDGNRGSAGRVLFSDSTVFVNFIATKWTLVDRGA